MSLLMPTGERSSGFKCSPLPRLLILLIPQFRSSSSSFSTLESYPDNLQPGRTRALFYSHTHVHTYILSLPQRTSFFVALFQIRNVFTKFLVTCFSKPPEIYQPRSKFNDVELKSAILIKSCVSLKDSSRSSVVVLSVKDLDHSSITKQNIGLIFNLQPRRKL